MTYKHIDYRRERNQLFRRMEDHPVFRSKGTRELIACIDKAGYPMDPKTWGILMSERGQWSRCLAQFLAHVLDCELTDLVQPHRYNAMDLCRNSRHVHDPDTGALLLRSTGL